MKKKSKQVKIKEKELLATEIKDQCRIKMKNDKRD